ncbi:PTS lactose/cellobiose transporter subunit IIA [Cytobacillus gottheilii]|uniref:PTS lactose/cellobiose transporter subunit IIA n=2 Tax=Bacillaceae TaxID=186817 RepID=A0A7V7UT12_9BACI|nr:MULTISPECIES: PTS lactose/cellobiose transporter subunit IIA [Bacillaceae]KAB2329310.1 PTS lactose/cellobiose transporter subunit IIA [Bacillus mesophilum]QVY60750.1 PTS lactose/cellobiose transporter subunit IIA [Cytobacillus gottheilii]
MEGLEAAAFQIISNVGTAKSLIMEALFAARAGNYQEAEEKLTESKQYMNEGHHAHMDLIQQEASGEKLPFSLLLMHAEDQMMSAETIRDLVSEMILMYKEMRS